MTYKKKYIMSFTSIGDYRFGVMSTVQKLMGNDLEIYAGEKAFDPSIKLINTKDLPYTRIKNIYLVNQRILIQVMPFSHYLFCDVLLLDLNPRVLNVWLLVFIRKLMGKPVVLWGHAWPRSGIGSKSDIIRGWLRKLAKNIVVYTDTQANELTRYDNTLNITAAPNALYSADQMNFINDSKRNDIIYVGRLVKEKKPEILLKSFISACSISDFLARLVFVGDGSERDRLESIVNKQPKSISQRIVFCGHINDYNTLSELYSHSFVSVSPGYVGLSITQSFSFGVPMIISKNEPHSPEIEAAIAGSNAIFFETDDIINLSNKLQLSFKNRNDLEKTGNEIVSSCQVKYSVENMAEKLKYSMLNCI